MKSLIKFILFVLFIIFAVSILANRIIIEKTASHFLHTPVKIESSRIILKGPCIAVNNVSIAKYEILISEAYLYFFPPKFVCNSLNYKNILFFKKPDFSFIIFLKNGWQFELLLKNIMLDKISQGIAKGLAKCNLKGFIKDKNLEFSGDVVLSEVVLLKKDFEIYDLSNDEIEDILQKNNRIVDIDFTYKGPIDKFGNIMFYKPGKKIMSLIKTYLLDKLIEKV